MLNNGFVNLDVKIIKHRFLKGDFGIYEVEIVNDSDVPNNNQFYINKNDTAVIKGNFDRRFYPDEEYEMYGTKNIHPKYGLNYDIKIVSTKFDTPDRIRAFLLRFCKESIVDQLLSNYGSDVIQKILDNEVDYSKINGMGEVRFKSLQEKVNENKYMKDIIVGLGDFGVTPNQMRNIAKKFGANAIHKIKENPYILCQVHGIGFLKADEVAKRMGYDMASTNRIDEAVKYTIEQMQLDGHSWVNKYNLLDNCSNLLQIDYDKIQNRLEDIPDIKIIDSRVTLQVTYNAEKYIASKLMELTDSDNELDFDVDEFIEKQKELYGYNLTDEQKQFFYNFKNKRVNFLIGYAGCGKTFLQKMVLSLAEQLNVSPLLLAPTGKAAKVLSEYTGKQAFTIHSALGVMDNTDDQTSIYEDWILVDESSMADIYIIYKLLRSLKNPKVRILFIGDDFQIPSVGVGLFLHNCIESCLLPVTKLTKVFRQEEGGILDIATKIRQGVKFIENDFEGRQQFGKDMLIHCLSTELIEKGYKHYFELAKKQFSIEEIITLSATKKNALGTYTMNNVLQTIENPQDSLKTEINHGQLSVFREGDRVINLSNYKAIDENDQEIRVVNGDIGTIEKIDVEKQNILIDYGFAKVLTAFSRLDKLSHAYAMTMHKSQGSGYKFVQIVADKAHKWQLNANLLYTAITRSKSFCVLLCQPDVINSAMRKNVNLERNTFLKEFLQEENERRLPV